MYSVHLHNLSHIRTILVSVQGLKEHVQLKRIRDAGGISIGKTLLDYTEEVKKVYSRTDFTYVTKT